MRLRGKRTGRKSMQIGKRSVPRAAREVNDKTPTSQWREIRALP